MATCIIPAAGSSKRMGAAKALLPWENSTVVEALVSAMRTGGVRSIWVVTGPNDQELPRRLAALEDVITTTNRDPERGMLSSILVGVDAAATDPRADWPLLACPVDHPALTAKTVEELLEASRQRPEDLLVPTYKGRRGHPLVIPEAFAGALADIDPAVGLRQLLEKNRRAVTELPVTDPGVVTNLNTLEDYKGARTRLL